MLEHAKKFLTPAQLSVMKLALSLHVYSPKVQMFGQIALERKMPLCTAVADVAGQLTCDVIQMKDIIEKVTLHMLSREYIKKYRYYMSVIKNLFARIL